MEAVHVLGRIHGQQALGGVEPVRQRQLEQDAVHVAAAVQVRDEGKQFFLTGAGGQVIGQGNDARLLAGAFLVPHIDLRGRVIPHKDDRQPRRTASLGRGLGNDLVQRRAHLLRHLFPVNQQHRTPLFVFSGGPLEK